MIKKLQIGLLVAVFSLFVGAGSAFADALTFSADTTISINGNSYVIQAGSTATTIVADTNTLTVTVPAASTFSLVSPNRYTLNNDGSLTQSCNNSANSVTITGAATVIITPVTTVCGGATGGGSLASYTSGGGSTTTSSTNNTIVSNTGSNSSTSPVTLMVTPPTTMTILTSIAGCMGTSGFSTVNGQSCANNTTATIIVGCSGTMGFSTSTGQSCAMNTGMVMLYDFGTVTLKNGSTGAAVMELQRFLNKFLSLGLVVDGKLGPKTIAVIKKWQMSKGLVADGLIGAKTKAMMQTEAESGN